MLDDFGGFMVLVSFLEFAGFPGFACFLWGWYNITSLGFWFDLVIVGCFGCF